MLNLFFPRDVAGLVSFVCTLIGFALFVAWAIWWPA